VIVISRLLKLVCFCFLFLSCSLIDNGYFTSKRTKPVEIPSTNAIQDLTITSPENITYTGPDSGYYLSSDGFENSVNGNTPNDWDPSETGGTVRVISEYDSHKKVLQFHDTSSSLMPSAYTYFPSQTFGSVEMWFQIDDSSKCFAIALEQASINPAFTLTWWSFKNEWRYAIGSTWYVLSTIPAPISNTWHHLTFFFERTNGGYQGLGQNKWKVTMDTSDSGALPLRYNLTPDAMRILLREDQADYSVFIDAIGYSWDPAYTIGDNMNEGLLLSYDSPISLDWTGYSLDNQINHFINGNTVIELPSVGSHSIQVFGNDSLGNNHESEITFFSIGDFTSNPSNPSPPNPFIFDWIFISVLMGIIGIASLMVIILLANRRRMIKMIPKKESPVKTISEAVFTCPYCHTEIDPKSNYCPYCSSKIKG
jgi:hypothetical protein